ncbi:hypothetical protein [Paenibacillus sp. GXUN7292]|uniref:hypothetical protein n=1 Tax=Paenibacillus sp. GXUN7292 TaxID=3422499 RepID=UPI003D7D1762
MIGNIQSNCHDTPRADTNTSKEIAGISRKISLSIRTRGPYFWKISPVTISAAACGKYILESSEESKRDSNKASAAVRPTTEADTTQNK